MSERLGKRVSRSITFYPTPEDTELLEALDQMSATQAITFSELCKIALHQFVQNGATAGGANWYTLSFAPEDQELQQRLAAALSAQGVSFKDWVKQRLLSPPADALALRVQTLEQAVAQLQNQPPPSPARKLSK